MNQIPKFQLAFQGGGARVIDLLAAAEVIEEFEKEGRLKVTRLAGTSAGSITAAIYACRTGAVKDINKFLHDKGPAIVNRVIGGADPNFGLSSLIKAWRGKALLNPADFRVALHKIFEIALPSKKAPYLFSMLQNTEIFIIGSDLVSQSQKIYQGSSFNLIDSIIDSCALPFVFRGHKDLPNNTIVDGGLCENLPTHVLKGTDASQYGPVLAVSFFEKSSGDVLRSVSGYLSSLFSTAINNSVKRAASSLPEGAILEIESELGTFDFKSALADDHLRTLETIKQKTRAWLERNLNSKPIAVWHNNPGAEFFMEELQKWYMSAHSAVKRRSVVNTLCVTGYSLLPPVNGYRRRDRIVKRYEFAPKNQPIGCLLITIDAGAVPGRADHRIVVLSPEGKKVSIRTLPTLEKLLLEKNGKTKEKISSLVLFEPPLAPMTDEDFESRGCYKLEYISEIEGGLVDKI